MSNRGLLQQAKIETSQQPNVPISHCLLVPRGRARVCIAMGNRLWTMARTAKSYFPFVNGPCGGGSLLVTTAKVCLICRIYQYDEVF